MRVINYTVTATATSIKDIIGTNFSRHCNSIGLQSAAGNGNIIYWGNDTIQTLEIAVGDSALLPVRNTNEVYIKGTPSDVLTIVLF